MIDWYIFLIVVGIFLGFIGVYALSLTIYYWLRRRKWRKLRGE